jgi:hypothetical protein
MKDIILSAKRDFFKKGDYMKILIRKDLGDVLIPAITFNSDGGVSKDVYLSRAELKGSRIINFLDGIGDRLNILLTDGRIARVDTIDLDFRN